MLGLLVRGFFLLTVVGWYSASLWKMIDGYFKGQFQRYLDEEFQRNPKMREDVLRYGAADKSASPVTEELQRVLQSCGDGGLVDEREVSCVAVGEADPARLETSGPSPADAFAAGAAREIGDERGKELPIAADAEKEVARLENAGDGLAFREAPARERDAEPPDLQSTAMPMDSIEDVHISDDASIPVKEAEPQQQPEQEQRKSQETPNQEDQLEHEIKKEQQRSRSSKKRKLSGRPPIGAKPEKAAGKKKYYEQSSPLTLTDEDFELAKRKRYKYASEVEGVVDRDFSEFDDEKDWSVNAFDDENEDDEGAGMPLADLPYKPAIDVYDLDWLSEKEFCPLTLDDDPTCEETRPWT